jgi:hypothetical protein
MRPADQSEGEDADEDDVLGGEPTLWVAISPMEAIVYMDMTL